MRHRWRDSLRHLANRWWPPPQLTRSAKALSAGNPPRIPVWRGFNLIDLAWNQKGGRFREGDFEQIAAWEFNFVRLPLSYRIWSSAENPETIREEALRPVDQAVAWGERYGIHINICLHRIPGYCINPDETEPFQLFGRGREQALEASSRHWRHFAQRYRGVSNERVSFDLLNEPPWMKNPAPYEAVVRALVAAIREEDAGRLIFADGIDIGQTPLWGLTDLGLVQSTRGYLPKAVTHHRAEWVPENEFEGGEPRWPLIDGRGRRWDKARLHAELIAPWKEIAAQGVPVHVGEWGCHHHTPHETALAWMGDMLELWREAGWGWALWNFRGSFGVVDSGRRDVQYEKLGKHLLDRRMLEMLRAG